VTLGTDEELEANKMNSYITLIVELEIAKEQLRKWGIPEQNGGSARRTRSLTQSRPTNLESIIWIVSCLVAILGLIKAAHSEQSLFWLAVWPFPAALACSIFIFVRQGFHFESGVLVLGRCRVDSAFGDGSDHKSSFR
jgi:hypothetical protein